MTKLLEKSSVQCISVPSDLQLLIGSTVFVLGAGASCSYGFPTGETLLQQLKTFQHRNSQTDIMGNLFFKHMSAYFKRVEILDFNKQLELFTSELNESGVKSIDTFLSEIRNEENLHEHLGRILISYLLRLHENKKTLSTEPDDDWISYFIHRFISFSRSRYEKDPPQVLTFNYDNLLEAKIRSNFSKTTGKVLLKTNINHIYGQVDISNYESSWSRDETESGKYYGGVIESARSIRLIRETKKSEPKEPNDFIRSAEVIIFLGYGFDPINNEILFGSKDCFDKALSEKKVYTTTYGLHQQIINRVYKVGDVKPGIKCRELLEHLYPPPLFTEEI